MNMNEYINIFLLSSILNMIIGSVGRWIGEQVVGGRLVSGLAVGEFNNTL